MSNNVFHDTVPLWHSCIGSFLYSCIRYFGFEVGGYSNLPYPMVELVVRDLTSQTQWIKHGCLKVNGVSRCSRSADVFEIPPRWIELQHRAIFEAGFPPYKTPAATYPVCVQELTWPLLWEDVRFDLKSMCLSNDQGQRRFAILILMFYFFSFFFGRQC